VSIKFRKFVRSHLALQYDYDPLAVLTAMPLIQRMPERREVISAKPAN
jgi:hypothetical protein